MAAREFRRVVLRGSLGVYIFAGCCVLAVVLVGDALVRGAWALAGVGLSVILALLWLQWWWLVSPALVVTRAGVQSVGALHRRMVPWAELAEVRPSFVTTLITTGGRKVRAPGAPTAGIDRAFGVSDLGVAAGQPASVLVAAARSQLADFGLPPRPVDVSTGWRWREALIFAALAGLAAALLSAGLV